MNIKSILYLLTTIAFFALPLCSLMASGVPDIFEEPTSIVTDTIPVTDRSGDFINDAIYNPFDILPSSVKQEVTYDAKTNRYILTEKIGDEYYRPPTYMTFDEYMDWRAKQDEKEYFENLSGIRSRRPSLSGKIDPMDRFDFDLNKSVVEKMFGGTEVNIKPQGSVDLTLGIVDYRRTEGAAVLNERQARQLFIPGDLRIQPRLNVDGSIGKKLNLGFNYDNSSTFNFDQKIKLDYAADAFNEDDILKKLEAGNVSMPLRGNLIQGGQALFGFKTELQFGHLRITGLLSQQRSRRNSLNIENGASVQEFDIFPNEFDIDRHFFISHYHRDTYEKTLQNLPQINTAFRIANIEVWVTNDRREFQDRSTMIAAVADIAEGDITKYHTESTKMRFPPDNNSPLLKGAMGLPLPDNNQNAIWETIIQNESSSDIDEVAGFLSMQGLKQTTDFEVFQGRLLNSSEYTYHPQLGTVSLNFRLRPDQVLAVSYKYFYVDNCDSVYTVGQLANEGLESSESFSPNEEPEPTKVLFTKLLKSSNPQTNFPAYDLMMKNVYNLRTSNLTRDGFTFDIYFEDDQNGEGLKKFIPGLETQPLLNVFNLDTLNRFGDPQSDGVFDYVPGVTVLERQGSIVFPVLEPFGNSLVQLLGDSILADSLAFNEIYDTSIVIGQQSLEKNKFLMRARVENATSGEINLGPSIPQGGVRVSAGGVRLVEGRDYEIDYSLGRLRIINPAFLSQGTPINVSYEDNGAFNLNTKTMNGLRLDYDFRKDFTLGATWLRYKERPFTQKVNLGEDPINNHIFGVDFSFNEDLPWLTNALDKLPFYSTTAPSSMSITAEAAYLLPGYNNAINLPNGEGGVVSIDDFEGAVNGFTLGGQNLNTWTHCSTPPEFAESEFKDSLVYGANRARLNWYQIDESSRVNTNASDPYNRPIDIQQLFDRQNDIGLNRLFTFDLSYYPKERGVYNFDVPGGLDNLTAGVTVDDDTRSLVLNEPESRWGGIMRAFQNPDFEAANYEFIEFWVMNPFMEREDGAPQIDGEEGELVIHLGNVSEDIINDGLQFYENGIPTPEELGTVPVTNTRWGRVPLTIPVVDGFDLEQIEEQDLGLDGLDDNAERIQYEDYLGQFPANIVNELAQDPANDNYVFYNSTELRENEPVLLNRYKGFNNPQGNAPTNAANQEANSENRFIRGNPIPDKEDLNNNRALDQAEAYHEYRLKFRNSGGEIDTVNNQFFRESRLVTNPGDPNRPEKWYRFVIPINNPTESVDIAGFRSIKFMRMYMTKFQEAKTFRLADFQLIRNLWRKSEPRCEGSDEVPGDQFTFAIDKVGVQENNNRKPFGYRSPQGILQENLVGTIGQIRQDEKSMELRFTKVNPGCTVGVNKLARINLTQYKKLQMFTHLEEVNNFRLEDDEVSIFIKIGKDLVNNYYEYELPLKVSRVENGIGEEEIWPDSNFISVELRKFQDAKIAKLKGEGRIDVNGATVIVDPDNPKALIKVKGTPSLGLIKIVEVGARNNTINSGTQRRAIDGSVWINELRCTGLEERGGYAAQTRAQFKLADLGELNLAASMSTIGFGGLDQRLQDRQQEDIQSYDAAVSIQAGKLLPAAMKLNLPVYAQITRNVTKPRFDAYQLDLKTEEVIEAQPDNDPTEIRDRSNIVETIKSVNLTNVKVDAGSGKMPWSPKNISATYSWTEKELQDPIIRSEKETETRIGLDYRYSMKPLYIRPFKFVKPKALKVISEFNFNLVPNAFSFTTNLDRFKNVKLFRLPDTPVFQFDDQRFKWDRNYNLDWDIAKSLRFTYKANTSSIIDELRQVGIAPTAEERTWVNEFGQVQDDEYGNFTTSVNDDPSIVNQYRNRNLRDLGRSKNYQHDVALSYKVPFRNIPILDWMTTSADYKASYGWLGGALRTIDGSSLPGNTIQNSQSRSLNANFDFSKLYKKSGYLKKIENGNRRSRRSRTSSRSRSRTKSTKQDDDKDDKKKKRKDREVSKLERYALRPLLVLRSVKLSYREDLGTIIPGFMPNAELLGLSSGFAAPGLDFALGLQPDLDRSNSNNFLLSNQEWFNRSQAFNDQLSQSQSHTINAKVKLEPFKDFDIDIDFNKVYRQDHTQVFKFLTKDSTNVGFSQQALYDFGSFEVTHVGLNTLFSDREDLYQQFKQNKILISGRLATAAGATDPHQEYSQYFEGYGPLSYAVNVPAFLATYTGQSIDQTSLTIREDIKDYGYIPKPNWQLRYNGLSKLAMFKDIIKSFQLKHGYRSTMAVSRFQTNAEFREETRFTEKTDLGDYYSQIEIPTMSINEQFNPVIGVSLKTESDISFNAEWNKSRRLNLNLQAGNMSEDLSNEFVLGFGYIVKDFKGFTKKKRRNRRKKNDGGDPDNPDDKDKAAKDKILDFARGGIVQNDQGRTLTINLDLAFADNVNLIYNFQDGTPAEPNRGAKTFQIEPSVEYQMFKNLALRWFANYQTSRPKQSIQNAVTQFQTGVTVRFNFN